MADYFAVNDRKDLGGVVYSRIFDPAAVAGAKVVYLEADPTGGAWLPPPAVVKDKTGATITSKLEYLVPYAAP